MINYCFLCRLVSLKNFNQFELTDRLLRILSVLFHADLISFAVDYSIITVGSVAAAQWRFYEREETGLNLPYFRLSPPCYSSPPTFEATEKVDLGQFAFEIHDKQKRSSAISKGKILHLCEKF